MITVHHLNNSRSQRVLWLLEELGVPYEIKFYERDPKTMLAPPSLRAVHPLGKSPVITDGDVTLAESGAIIEYLIGRYGEGRLIPAPDTPEALRFRYWMHYAEGSVTPPILLKLVFEQIAKAKMAFFAKPIARKISEKALSSFVMPQLNQHLDYIESELARSTWFAGEELTGADMQMSFAMESAAAGGGPASSRPRIMAFLARVHARPAYQRAVEKGGAFSMAR